MKTKLLQLARLPLRVMNEPEEEEGADHEDDDDDDDDECRCRLPPRR
jgi:hypothetical protein